MTSDFYHPQCPTELLARVQARLGCPILLDALSVTMRLSSKCGWVSGSDASGLRCILGSVL